MGVQNNLSRLIIPSIWRGMLVLFLASELVGCEESVSPQSVFPLPATIAFQQSKNADGQSDIYVISARGELRPVAAQQATHHGPSWSPDGKPLTYDGDVPSDIFVINIDETGERNLTNYPWFDERPLWSPTGEHILWISWRAGSADIFVVDSSGENQRNLTPFPKYDFLPDWSPDGRQIAFVSSRDGNSEIYLRDVVRSYQRSLPILLRMRMFRNGPLMGHSSLLLLEPNCSL